MKKCLITSLSDLELELRIGVGAEERLNLQKVKVSFYIYQYQLPATTCDDNANDYVCYNKLSCLIHDYCKDKEFKTIEYLCYQLYKIVKGEVPIENEVKIVVEKCHPQMGFINGSSRCEYYE